MVQNNKETKEIFEDFIFAISGRVFLSGAIRSFIAHVFALFPATRCQRKVYKCISGVFMYCFTISKEQIVIFFTFNFQNSAVWGAT